MLNTAAVIIINKTERMGGRPAKTHVNKHPTWLPLHRRCSYCSNALTQAAAPALSQTHVLAFRISPLMHSRREGGSGGRSAVKLSL